MAGLQLAIFSRSDQRYRAVDERVLSFKAGEADRPEIVPFPTGADGESFSMTDSRLRDSLFGTFDDAFRRGRAGAERTRPGGAPERGSRYARNGRLNRRHRDARRLQSPYPLPHSMGHVRRT